MTPKRFGIGAKERELLGIETTNPRLQAALENGGFTATTIPVLEELGGDTFTAISRVESVESPEKPTP